MNIIIISEIFEVVNIARSTVRETKCQKLDGLTFHIVM